MNRKTGWARGFTLIELLVVIGIIGLLAAILVPSIMAAVNTAKRTRALSQIRDLDAAVKRYFGEYGRMPVPAGMNGGADRVFSGAEQAAVIEILINQCDPSLNPKKISFLDLDPSSFGVKTVAEMLVMLQDGTPYKGPFNKEFDEEEFQPRDYYILMDLNFDDRITDQSIPGLSKDISNLRTKAAVFWWGMQPGSSSEAANYEWKSIWTW